MRFIMEKYYTLEIPKTDRIPKLVADLYAKMPEIESARARLIILSFFIYLFSFLPCAYVLNESSVIILEMKLIILPISVVNSIARKMITTIPTIVPMIVITFFGS